MPPRKKRRRRQSTLAPKFVVRRMILVFFPLILVLSFVLWLMLRTPSPKREKESSELSQASQQQTVSQAVSAAASQPEPEPPAVTADAAWNLLLVGPSNPLPEGYVESITLETITETYQVDQRIADSLRKMFTKAKEDGINLMLCSAFRTVERQTEIFNAQKQKNLDQGLNEEEAVAAAITLVTKPGNSEHHTGLAVDIVTPTYQNLDEGFADTAAFRWLSENAANYGYILRYPKEKEATTQINYEPWHYRYVGEEYAKAIKKSGYCLEEFLYVTMKDQAARLADMEEGLTDSQQVDAPSESTGASS